MTSLSIYVTLTETWWRQEVSDPDRGSDTQMLQGNIRSHLSLSTMPPPFSSRQLCDIKTPESRPHKINITLSSVCPPGCGWTIIFLWITGKVLRSVIGFQAKLSIKQPLVRGFLFPFIDGEIDFLGNENLKTDLIFSCHEIFWMIFLQFLQYVLFLYWTKLPE